MQFGGALVAVAKIKPKKAPKNKRFKSGLGQFWRQLELEESGILIPYVVNHSFILLIQFNVSKKYDGQEQQKVPIICLPPLEQT